MSYDINDALESQAEVVKVNADICKFQVGFFFSYSDNSVKNINLKPNMRKSTKIYVVSCLCFIHTKKSWSFCNFGIT